MSFDSQMIHTCVIERDPMNGSDLHGNAPVNVVGATVTVVPELIYTGMCRLVEKMERILTERSGRTAVKVYKLLVPPGAVIQDRDRVKSVTLEDGTILTDAFVVTTNLNRRRVNLSHLSLDLERVA